MSRTWHLSAFFKTMKAPLTLSQIDAVAESSYNIQSGRVFIPEDRTLLAAFAGGVALGVTQIDSASLILNGRPNIVPVDGDAAGGNLAAIMYAGKMGLRLPALEQIAVLMTIGGVALSDMFAALFHSGGYVEPPPGPIRTVHATAAATPAKGVWGSSVLTFDTSLMKGRYAVVGLTAYGTNLLFARLSFVNQVDRPGCLASTAFTAYQLPFFRNGSMGLWGTFDNYNPPMIECLGTGVPTTQDVFLDLVQIS